MNPPELAAFDCSMLVLITCGYFIMRDFKQENYGDTSIDVKQTIGRAVSALRRDPSILLLGLAQSCLESSMYIFVFMWTPALENTAGSAHVVNHGWIFANFMVCCMLGTDIFGLVTSSASLNAAYRVSSIERLLCILMIIGAIAMFLVSVFSNFTIRFVFLYHCQMDV